MPLASGPKDSHPTHSDKFAYRTLADGFSGCCEEAGGRNYRLPASTSYRDRAEFLHLQAKQCVKNDTGSADAA